jgi:cytidine deaminase
MCAAAIAEARIARLVYGAADPKGGGVEHGPRVFAHSRHRPEIVAGIAEPEAAALLRDFFAPRR